MDDFNRKSTKGVNLISYLTLVYRNYSDIYCANFCLYVTFKTNNNLNMFNSAAE